MNRWWAVGWNSSAMIAWNTSWGIFRFAANDRNNVCVWRHRPRRSRLSLTNWTVKSRNFVVPAFVATILRRCSDDLSPSGDVCQGKVEEFWCRTFRRHMRQAYSKIDAELSRLHSLLSSSVSNAAKETNVIAFVAYGNGVLLATIKSIEYKYKCITIGRAHIQ